MSNIDKAPKIDEITNIDQIAHQIAEGVLSKIEIQVALLGVLAVIIGAILQYFFARLSEKSQQLALLRNESYVDYLRAVAKSAHSNSSSEKATALMEATDAKTRIAIYGSRKVIKALAEFEKAGAKLNNERSTSSFFDIVNAMRLGGAVSNNSLSQILMGTKPKDKGSS